MKKFLYITALAAFTFSLAAYAEQPKPEAWLLIPPNGVDKIARGKTNVDVSVTRKTSGISGYLFGHASKNDLVEINDIAKGQVEDAFDALGRDKYFDHLQILPVHTIGVEINRTKIDEDYAKFTFKAKHAGAAVYSKPGVNSEYLQRIEKEFGIRKIKNTQIVMIVTGPDGDDPMEVRAYVPNPGVLNLRAKYPGNSNPYARSQNDIYPDGLGLSEKVKEEFGRKARNYAREKKLDLKKVQIVLLARFGLDRNDSYEHILATSVPNNPYKPMLSFLGNDSFDVTNKIKDMLADRKELPITESPAVFTGRGISLKTMGSILEQQTQVEKTYGSKAE